MSSAIERENVSSGMPGKAAAPAAAALQKDVPPLMEKTPVRPLIGVDPWMSSTGKAGPVRPLMGGAAAAEDAASPPWLDGAGGGGAKSGAGVTTTTTPAGESYLGLDSATHHVIMVRTSRGRKTLSPGRSRDLCQHCQTSGKWNTN